MTDRPKPPKRDKATIRPYIGASFFEAVRGAFPHMDSLTDREFIEFALAVLMDGRLKPDYGLKNKIEPREAKQANDRSTDGIDDDRSAAKQLSDPTDIDF
jgi:hypothetical protein